MQTPPAFPSLPQALLLALALILFEMLAQALLYDLGDPLGLSPQAIWPLAMVLGNAMLFLLLLPWLGLGYRQLFHPSQASPWAIAGLTLLPLALVTPLLALVLERVSALMASLLPISAAEQAMFDAMADPSLPTVLAVCLLAPVLEEMLFRGVVLRGLLTRLPRGHAIAASALLFGLAHLNVYQYVVAALLGLLLGWLYERTRSLIPCIALHAAYNSLLTALDAPLDADAVPWTESGPLWGAGLLGGVIGAWLLRRVLLARPGRA